MAPTPPPADQAAPLPAPPAAAFSEGTFHYGRYRGPIPDPTFPLAWGQRLRLKEWHYCALTGPHTFLALGLVQLGYLAKVFVYLVDRSRPGEALEYEALLPLGRGLEFAQSSIAGTSSLRHRGALIEAGFDGAHTLRLDLPLGGSRLEGEARFPLEETLALLHPLPSGQPAYTHKAAAAPAEVALRLGGRPLNFEGALASLDWTRSLAERETRWKWASTSARLKSGARLGLNLSAEVYDDARGHSRENALWIDGAARPLGGVRFELPDDRAHQPWRIRSLEGDEVSLRFQPLGARRQDLDLKLISSRFIQPYGRFEGEVCGHRLEGAFGVVEEHFARW